MNNIFQLISLRTRSFALISFISLLLLTACQSIPPAETNNIDNDVCVGEAVVVDPDKPVDLEAMAKQTDCE